MTIRIDSVGIATSPKWDEVWNKCAYATYFHSREWAETWGVYSKGNLRPEPLLFRFSDGLESIFPLSVRRSYRGLFEEYVSSPAGTFGGWISEATLSQEHVTLVMAFLKNRKAGLYWRLNPYDDASAFVTSITASDVTHAVDLRPGFDTVHRNISASHRTAARKAARSGVSIEESCRMEDWADYYGIYEDSMRRWGSSVSSRYSMELFSEMRRRNSPSTKLWLARHNGTIIAGALCLYSKTHVAYWHGATLEEHFNLRGPHLLFEEAIRHACRQGYAWFDFNPSGGHEGPKTFKERFGAQPLSCPVIHTRAFTLRAAEKVRNWRWAPAPKSEQVQVQGNSTDKQIDVVSH